jgi:hypothetical protein
MIDSNVISKLAATDLPFEFLEADGSVAASFDITIMPILAAM